MFFYGGKKFDQQFLHWARNIHKCLHFFHFTSTFFKYIYIYLMIEKWWCFFTLELWNQIYETVDSVKSIYWSLKLTPKSSRLAQLFTFIISYWLICLNLAILNFLLSFMLCSFIFLMSQSFYLLPVTFFLQSTFSYFVLLMSKVHFIGICKLTMLKRFHQPLHQKHTKSFRAQNNPSNFWYFHK